MKEIIKNIYMVRKPSDLEEVISTSYEHINDIKPDIEVVETVELSAEDYDKLCKRPLADYRFLAGKGGYENDIRQVVKITAPERQILFVDPSGSSYCRYLGILM